MSISASDSAWLAGQFDATDIGSLNARAEMLQRLDNKYIVAGDALEEALPLFVRRFDVLEIEGRRAFGYENRYFDGLAWQSYFDHHQGRRKRAKVRMRRYLDSGACFAEIKLKDRRGITVKQRLACDAASFGVLDRAAEDYVRAAYRAMYDNEFPYGLASTIDTLYTRLTLVAKNGGERMTIDSGLHFRAGGRSRSIAPGLFILETKSANGNGLADRILRAVHEHPMKHCSKYCAGMVFLQAGLKHNNFRSVVRKLGRDPADHAGGDFTKEQP